MIFNLEMSMSSFKHDSARIPRPGRNLASLFLSSEVGLMQVLLGLLGAISLQVPYMSISSLFVSRNRDFMGVLVG